MTLQDFHIVNYFATPIRLQPHYTMSLISQKVKTEFDYSSYIRNKEDGPYMSEKHTVMVS
jgi:hypothetical protein